MLWIISHVIYYDSLTLNEIWKGVVEKRILNPRGELLLDDNNSIKVWIFLFLSWFYLIALIFITN